MLEAEIGQCILSGIKLPPEHVLIDQRRHVQKNIIKGFWFLAALCVPFLAVFVIGGWNDTFRSGDANAYVVGAILVGLAEAIVERRQELGPDLKDWWWVKLQNPLKLGLGSGPAAIITLCLCTILVGLNFYYAISDHHSEADVVDWVQIVAVFLSLLPLVSVRFAVTENPLLDKLPEPMDDYGGLKLYWVIIRHRQAQRWLGTGMDRVEQGKFRNGLYRIGRADTCMGLCKDLSCKYTVLWYQAAARRARGGSRDRCAADDFISEARQIAEKLGVPIQGPEAELQQDILLNKQILSFRTRAFGDADPRTLSTLQVLAGLYCQAGLYDEAIAQYEHILGFSDPASAKDAPRHVPDAALARSPRARNLLARYNYAPLYYGLGQALRAAGRLAESEASLREAACLNPGEALVHEWLGTVLLDLGRFAEAESTFREAARLDPSKALMHEGLGTALGYLGRYAEAEAAFLEAARLNPSDATAHSSLGYLYLHLGDAAKAYGALREALRCNPDFAPAYRNLGRYYVAGGNLRAAEWRFRQASQAAAPAADPYSELMLGVLDRHVEDEAREHFRAALRALDAPGPSLAPKSAFQRAEIRALALAGLGRGTEAAAVFAAAAAERSSADIFGPADYDLLASHMPSQGINEIISIWHPLTAGPG